MTPQENDALRMAIWEGLQSIQAREDARCVARMAASLLAGDRFEDDPIARLEWCLDTLKEARALVEKEGDDGECEFYPPTPKRVIHKAVISQVVERPVPDFSTEEKEASRD